MPDRAIAITDTEARLAAQGKLGALVRVMKPQPEMHERGYYTRNGEIWLPKYAGNHSIFPGPGQRLGLKETWGEHSDGMDTGDGSGHVFYKADGHHPFDGKWHSPVSIPAWAIRHWPTVQEVRAVQVCRMQPEDAILLGFSTKLREHDAVCHLRGQVAEHYHLTPETWVWFAQLEWRTHD